jgi:CHAD domain-containing protein
MTNNPDSALHREELLSVTEERFQKMNARLKAVAETFKEEDIHDFRIEIKKLKHFYDYSGKSKTSLRSEISKISGQNTSC